MKIGYSDLTRIISRHSEVSFEILGDEEYNDCCMGNDGSEKPYWLGLTPDGGQAYAFATFEEMASAPVFRGKSLKEIIDKADITSIDACDPEFMYKKL